MKAPNKDQREALGRLQFSRDGKVLVTFLEESVAEVTNRMISDEDLHRVRAWQGECRALRELINLLTPVSS